MIILFRGLGSFFTTVYVYEKHYFYKTFPPKMFHLEHLSIFWWCTLCPILGETALYLSCYWRFWNAVSSTLSLFRKTLKAANRNIPTTFVSKINELHYKYLWKLNNFFWALPQNSNPVNQVGVIKIFFSSTENVLSKVFHTTLWKSFLNKIIWSVSENFYLFTAAFVIMSWWSCKEKTIESSKTILNYKNL